MHIFIHLINNSIQLNSASFKQSCHKENKSLRELLIYYPKHQNMFCFSRWFFPCISEKFQRKIGARKVLETSRKESIISEHTKVQGFTLLVSR